MQHGKIVSFSERNSGFIKCAGMKETLFFDASDLVGIDFNSLSMGDTLLFTVTESRKGPYATEVSKSG